jgi:ParB family chromosome partitioning protein
MSSSPRRSADPVRTFETRVKVELGRSKGKIVVEFASIDDLERIVKAMSPEAASAAQRADG